jgi:hypothetical protein
VGADAAGGAGDQDEHVVVPLSRGSGDAGERWCLGQREGADEGVEVDDELGGDGDVVGEGAVGFAVFPVAVGKLGLEVVVADADRQSRYWSSRVSW